MSTERHDCCADLGRVCAEVIGPTAANLKVAEEGQGPKRSRAGYGLRLFAVLVFLALTLLAVLDFAKGFLFGGATAFWGYHITTPYFHFSILHPVMMAIGAAGLLLGYASLRAHEAELGRRELDKYMKLATVVVFGMLVVDVFIYRAVGAAHSAAVGQVDAGWMKAFGVSSGWLRPVALDLSYLALVWYAMLVAALFAGLALAIIPRFLAPYFARKGLEGSLVGALFALPQPFCSCCASMVVPSLARRGASPAVCAAYVVGCPMLNVSTLILAAVLLTPSYAITRILAGILFAVPLTYLAALLDERWARWAGRTSAAAGAVASDPGALVSAVKGLWDAARNRVVIWLGLYCSVFHVDDLVKERAVDAPSGLLLTWAVLSGRIFLLMVPILFVWGTVATAVLQVMGGAFGNGPAGVLVAAVAGTAVMIPTWAEIPIAQQMISAGLTGPAATMLVTLPAVSVPCLMILAGSSGNFRLVTLLALGVALSGIVVGLFFI